VARINLDDFRFEINLKGMTGSYSESEALEAPNLAAANDAHLAPANVSQLLMNYQKPIGNCRSGHLVVINPPQLVG
jgi:hypothetical protein